MNKIFSILVILGPLSAFAMEAAPTYTKSISEADGIHRTEYCAFGDEKYPDGYCVASYQKYREAFESPESLKTLYIADKNLSDSYKKLRQVWPVIKTVPSVQIVRNNFRDLEVKHQSQQSIE